MVALTEFQQTLAYIPVALLAWGLFFGYCFWLMRRK
jgi:hypothetical protein